MLELEQQALRNIDQELKEAVCNALVNMTVIKVTGSGVEGETLYCPSPRRMIVSGLLLPRFDRNQQDDTSDIKIAAIGMDFQVHATSNVEATVLPNFSVYVRVLPDWDELRNVNLGLDIEFQIQTAVQSAIDARNRQLRDERYVAAGVDRPQWASLTRDQKQQIRNTRNRIQQEVTIAAYLEQGIHLEPGDELIASHIQSIAEAETSPEPAEARLRIDRLLQRGRIIPHQLLEPADSPPKWKRIDLNLPEFRWNIQRGAAEISTQLTDYCALLRQAVTDQVTEWLNSPDGIRNAWRNLRVSPSDVISADAWNTYRIRAQAMPIPFDELLPKVDGVSIEIDRILDYTNPQIASVRVTLDNGTEEIVDRLSRTKTDTLFNTKLTVKIPNNAHVPLKLDRVEPSYRFRNFLAYHAIGLNCGIENAINGDDLVLTTTWAPRFVQPRVIPRYIDLPITFSALSSDTLDLTELLTLPRNYEDWAREELSRLRNVVREGLDHEQAELETRRLELDISAQRQEAQFIERGIRLLLDSQFAYRQINAERSAERREELLRLSAPYRAWLLTNRSFFHRDRQSATRGWRLFQLAFILAHVPTIASRMEEYRNYQNPLIDEEAASLLYFPTGGGKSEAFYGTLLYAMFVDRLRGKNRGVTAMIRYPLRLLTLQQGQRLLKLVAQAEILRETENIGNWPFEIGFWVGGKNTPNRYSEVPAAVPLSNDAEHTNDERLEENFRNLTDRERRAAAKYREFRASYNKVQECPICNSVTGLRRFQSEGETAKRLAIVCFNTECRHNLVFGLGAPLPFLLTDDTIYQRSPAILLGTIDKLAMLGQSTSTIRQLIGMFGLARGIGSTGHLISPPVDRSTEERLREDGYSPAYPAFTNGERIFHDPFPSLIIQDEAHLLEESLGTFSGLFDTLLENVFKKINNIAGRELSVALKWNGQDWGTPRMPKVIAATATISNPDRQLEVLYQRRVLRFPCPGSDIYRSFYSEPERAPIVNSERVQLENSRGLNASPEQTAPWMRLFVSIMTNGATHTVTAVAILSSFHTIITQLWNGILNDDTRVETIRSLRNFQGNDFGSSWREAAIDRSLNENRHSEVMALIDLHRIALAYVTNKKGGDQVMDALISAVKQRHRLINENIDDFNSRLISGGIEMKEIQQIMEQAEESNPNHPYRGLQSLIRSIVATSAISHGVDVDRFNSMFFAGLPSDIAEYIQASSRVGRTHVGFVILVPTPQSRRDRYVVETHDIFHRFLERMIAPPAVERWAENAIRRVLASLVQAWITLQEANDFVRASVGEKSNVDSCDNTASISASARNRYVEVTEEMGNFILRSIGFEGRGETRYGEPVYRELYRSLVMREVSNFANSLRTLNTPMKFYEYWKDPASEFKPPMTSLRDVDEAGIIAGGAFDMYSQGADRRINQEQLATVMKAIRNQRGSVAEMDFDPPEESQT
jgi:hypothetical protein